jgi:hypothetical protein
VSYSRIYCIFLISKSAIKVCSRKKAHLIRKFEKRVLYFRFINYFGTTSYHISKKIKFVQPFWRFLCFYFTLLCLSMRLKKCQEIEKIQLKFSKHILNVKLSTSNVGVYGELACFSLYINRYVRIIKFWLKTLNTKKIT